MGRGVYALGCGMRCSDRSEHQRIQSGRATARGLSSQADPSSVIRRRSAVMRIFGLEPRCGLTYGPNSVVRPHNKITNLMVVS